MDRTTRMLLLGVAACAVLFGLILLLAYGFPAARELDAKALQGFLGLQRPSVDAFASNFVHFGDPPVVGVVGAGLACVALLRGRPRVAAAVIGLLAVTSVSSQLLKALLAYPRYESQTLFSNIGPEAFPSGHSTAMMALAIACVMVLPARVRPLAAFVGSGLALGMAFAVIAGGSHFPSDVAGGFLLATGWGLAIAAGLRLAAERWPERIVRARLAVTVRQVTEVAAAASLTAIAVTGIALVLLAALLVIGRGEVVDLARGHTAAVLVGGALAVLAVALLAGVMLGLRQRGQQ